MKKSAPLKVLYSRLEMSLVFFHGFLWMYFHQVGVRSGISDLVRYALVHFGNSEKIMCD